MSGTLVLLTTGVITAGVITAINRPTAPLPEQPLAHHLPVSPATEIPVLAPPPAPTRTSGRVVTYRVSTHGTVTEPATQFQEFVAATLGDPRGWARAGLSFRDVTNSPGKPAADFTIILAQAQTLPSFSPGCSEDYSCRHGNEVIINLTRWRDGSPEFPAPLNSYRQMVINHEVGHWLGFGHAYCGSPESPAAVMQQQSKGMQGCTPNAWPLDQELDLPRSPDPDVQPAG